MAHWCHSLFRFSLTASSRFPQKGHACAPAEVIGSQPAALQLRYLQTLTEIAMEKNSTIIFPLPIDLIEPLMQIMQRQASVPVQEPLDGSLKDEPSLPAN